MRLRQPTISYDRDEQFAVSLLTLLRHRGQTLPPAAQATLIALATEPHGFGHARTQAAVKTLLSLHPVLAKSVALDDMQSLSFLPVCIWAAEQKGNPDCGLRARVLDWQKQFSTDSVRTLEKALRALNISYALRDEFSEKDLRVLAGFWQDDNKESLGQKVYTLGSERHQVWCDLSVRLGLFHEHLASVGIKEDTSPGQPAWHLRWAASMGAALSPMSTVQQSECIEQWVKSDLSDVYTLRASKYANPLTWLMPEVSSQLSPLLPNSEVVRWKMLPWAQNKNTSDGVAALLASTNQAMLRAYCPLAGKVLDVVTTPEMWRSKKTIDACMAQFAKNTPQVEELPHAGDLFDMA